MRVDTWLDERPVLLDERAAVRAAAADKSRARPLPVPRSEHWKYTSTRAIGALGLEIGATAATLTVGAAPQGVTIVRWSEASPAQRAAAGPWFGRLATFDGPEAFVALNTALHDDVVLILVEAGADVADAVRIVHVAGGEDTPRVVFPRVLVLAEAGAKATVIAEWRSARGAPFVTAPVTELVVGDGASLEYVSVVATPASDFHLATVASTVAPGATLQATMLAFGEGLARCDTIVTLAGAGASVRLEGVGAAGASGHIDHHTTIDHAAPDCTSREVFRNIAGDHGTVVFNGRVVVREQAQRSDSDQQNRSLLLSDDATINSKPELEIYADDVKCAHGSAIGALDPEQVWYLRSRGIPDALARQMLVRGFGADVAARVAHPGARALATDALEAWLDQLIAGGAA